MRHFATADESRANNVTYHLAPRDVWDAQRRESTYLPEGFDQDGFIHCTDGLDELLIIANMFYTEDPREFVVLDLEVPAIESEVRYDDEEERYPHIYGLLNTSAVRGEANVLRDADGAFLSFSDR